MSKSDRTPDSSGNALAAAAAAAATLQGPAATMPVPQYRVQTGGYAAASAPGHQPSAEEINALIGAAEARTDAKVVQAVSDLRIAIGELKGDLQGEFKALRAATVGKTTLVVTALSLFGAIAALLAYGSQLFGQGLDASTVAESAAVKAIREAPPYRPAAAPAPAPPVPVARPANERAPNAPQPRTD